MDTGPGFQGDELLLSAATDMQQIQEVEPLDTEVWLEVFAATRTTAKDSESVVGLPPASTSQLAWATSRALYSVDTKPVFTESAATLAGFSSTDLSVADLNRACANLVRRHLPPNSKAVTDAAAKAGVTANQISLAMAHLADANIFELLGLFRDASDTEITETDLRSTFAPAGASIPPGPPANPDDYDPAKHF